MANFTHVQQVDLDYELALCSIYDIINNFFSMVFKEIFAVCMCYFSYFFIHFDMHCQIR